MSENVEDRGVVVVGGVTLVDPLSAGVATRLLECLARLLPYDHEEDRGMYGRDIVNALLGNDSYWSERRRDESEAP